MNPVSALIATPLTALFMMAFLTPAISQEKAISSEVGRSFVVQVKPGTDTEGKPKPLSKDAVDQVISVLEKRLNDGPFDIRVDPVGTDKLEIQMPGVPREAWEDVRQKILQAGNLEFRLVHPQTASLNSQQGYIRLPMANLEAGENDKDLLVKDHADMDGKYVKAAFASLDPNNGWMIILKFDKEGTKLFGELTAAHTHERLAIVVDGEVISAPMLNEAILGGSAQISGKFTERSARFLASALENPLENPLVILQEGPASASTTGSQRRLMAFAGLGLIIVFLALCVVVTRKIRRGGDAISHPNH